MTPESLGQLQLSRRDLLKVGGTAALLAACGSRTEVTPSPSLAPAASVAVTPPSPDQSAERQRLARFEQYHHPTVEGKEISARPYLSLPFRDSDLQNGYDITEGWVYSDGERAIHGFEDHMGVDFAVPHGTPVVSPVEGFAMSSFHTFFVRDDSGSFRKYQDQPVKFGLGYFVQIYVPSENRFVQLAHLSDVDPSIPFSKPEREGDGWNPTNHNLTIKELMDSAMVVRIKKGDPIGKVGYSGLALGDIEEYQPGAERPVVNPNVKSWDEPHLHLEEVWRDQATDEKTTNRDPYGIYSTAQDYPTPARAGIQTKEPLFVLEANGLPNSSS